MGNETRHRFGKVVSAVDEPSDGKLCKGPHKVVCLKSDDGKETFYVNMPPDSTLKEGDLVFMELEAGTPAADLTISVLRAFNWNGPGGKVETTEVPNRLQGSPAPEPAGDKGGEAASEGNPT